MDLKATLTRLFNLTAEDSIDGMSDEMTGGTGFLSYRRRLKIQRGGSTMSVFLKLSDRSRQDLGQLKEFSDHFCPRECLFYGCFAPLLERTAAQFNLGSIGLPNVYHELVLPTGSLLVMEDLCEAGFQLAPAAMNLAEARCILAGLARLQATFWLTKARLGASSAGLFGPDSPLADALGSMVGSESKFDEFLTVGYETFRRDFTKHLKCEKRVAIINAYLNDGFLDKARRAMQTNREEREAIGLTHSDLWYNNCLISREASTGQPLDSRIIDWQFFGIGGLAYDLGPMWVSSVDNAIVGKEFLPCVEFYHDSIRELYESKMQTKFPVSLERTRQQALESLNWGVAWVVLSADTMWAFESIGSVLSNVADIVEHFKL